MIEIERVGEPLAMGGGEARYLDLDLEAGDLLRVKVEQRGIDVALRLIDPEGEPVVEVDSPVGENGDEELAAIAPIAGRYRLVVEAPGEEEMRGEILVHPSERRPASDEDRSMVGADEAYREGRGLIRQRAPDRAIERLNEALEVFRRRQWRSREALTLDALSLAYQKTGELRAAVECCEAALPVYRRNGYSHMASHLLDRAGWLHLQLGQTHQAVERLNEAVGLFSSDSLPERLAVCLAHLGTAHHRLGDAARAEETFGRALDAAAAGGDEVAQARVLADYGTFLLGRRRTYLALGAYGEAIEVFRRLRRYRPLALALSGMAAAALEVGALKRGEKAITEALERLDAPGDRRYRAVALNTLGNLKRRAGELDAARAAYDEALALARETEDRSTEAIVLLDLGHLQVLEGEPRRGLERIDRAQALFTELGDLERERTARVHAAEALRALDRLDEACDRLLPVLDTVETSTRPRAYEPIEPIEEPSEPINPAHTDLPGGGDDDAVPATVRAELERRRRASRNRRRDAAMDLQSRQDTEFPESISLAPDLDAGDSGPGEIELVEPADLTPQDLGRRLVAAWQASAPVALTDQVNLAREYEEAAREEIELRKTRRELPSTVDPHELAETGWGVIVSRDEDPAVLHGLYRLIERRHEQAGARFKELTYHPYESGRRFLWLRYAEAPGVLDPDVLPYYLLIVGGPESIPFELQYDLAINHAVGRIAFDDPEGYRQYAETVLAAEDGGVDLPRRATIFSVENAGDRATSLLAEHMVAPLAQRLPGFAGWEVDVWDGERAYKRDLRLLLGGEATPGLLLASCHGVKKAPGSPDQTARQGALLCRDWPGEGHSPAPAHSFSGDDLAAEAPELQGLIAYLFACYGAGTPLEDNFPHQTRKGMVVGPPPPAQPLALDPFVARLPQELLSHGALAVVGHIDRGWTTAFQWAIGDVRAEAVRSLEDSLKQLLGGGRIGHTLRPLVRRYTAIASQLAENLERVRNGEEVDEELVAFQWTAHNDARNVLLLGDPAVYLLGRRCWVGEVETTDDTARIELDPEIAPLAAEKARAAGMSVGEWINELVRRGVERESSS